MIKIAPSILSADFACLGSEIKDVAIAGADYIHVDVMDGIFVPNISVGIPVLKSLRSTTDMFLDVHLMIERPLRYIDSFCAAGADLLNIHAEADTEDNNIKALCRIKELGKKCALTLKPATPAQVLAPYLPILDLVLIMTVEPGFGGQGFMPEQLRKIGTVRRMIDEGGFCCEIEADGGIDAETAAMAYKAGCDVLVSGSYIFGSRDRGAAIAALKAACVN